VSVALGQKSMETPDLYEYQNHGKLLELICMYMISKSILLIWICVGIANVSPNYIHVYD